MQLRGVGISDRGGNPTLGILGIGFGKFSFGEKQDPSSPGEFNCGAKPCNTAADDNEIGIDTFVLRAVGHRSKIARAAEVSPIGTSAYNYSCNILRIDFSAARSFLSGVGKC